MKGYSIFAVACVCLLWLAAPSWATTREEYRAWAQQSFNQGVTEEKSANYDALQRALGNFQTARQQWQQAGDTVDEARALNHSGQVYLRLSQAPDAAQRFREALNLLAATPSPQVEVDARNGLAKSLVDSKTLEAQKQAEQAAQISAQINYPAGQAEAKIWLSAAQNATVSHFTALQTAQEALALWRTLGDKAGEAEALNQIGQFYTALNQLAEASQSYQAALLLWRTVSDQAGEAEALKSLSLIEARKGNYNKALSYIEQTRQIIDPRTAPGKMAAIAAITANAYLEAGAPAEAVPFYQQALESCRQAQSPRDETFALMSLAQAQHQAGDTEAALASLRAAEVTPFMASTLAYQAYLHGVYGDVYAADNPARALQHFQQAVDKYNQTENPKEIAYCQARMGQIHFQQNRPGPAAALLQTALGEFQRLSDTPNEAAVQYELGRLKMAGERWDEAGEHFKKSLTLTEELRAQTTDRKLLTAFSANVYQRYAGYIDWLMAKHRQEPDAGWDAQAFNASEQARARSLLDYLQAAGVAVTEGIDPTLRERAEVLRQQLTLKTEEKISVLNSKDTEKVTALAQETARLESEYRQVEADIKARYPDYAALMQPHAWPSEQVQRELLTDDDTVLLAYWLGTEHSYLWVVTRNTLHSQELKHSYQEIDAAGKRLHQLLSTNPYALDAKQKPEETIRQVNEALEQVSEMVVRPVAQHLRNKKRWLVIADGVLHYIPFQALSLQPDAPLVEDYEIINGPSASVLGLVSQVRGLPADKVIAAFGNPVFSADDLRMPPAALASNTRQARLNNGTREQLLDALKPLGFSDEEIAAITRQAPASGRFVALGFDASLETLKNLPLGQYRILHFSTHGLWNEARPQDSGLVLSRVGPDGQARDGFLTVQDVYNLRAPVGLVVLSACQTALGKNVRGEGLIGLTRGFMYAGASGVAASLWSVDDKATAELMQNFYDRMLREGQTPAAALRAAQKYIRRQNGWQTPYYWAAFTLQGNYRQQLKPEAPGKWQLPLLGGLLLLAGAGALFLHRRKQRPPLR